MTETTTTLDEVNQPIDYWDEADKARFSCPPEEFNPQDFHPRQIFPTDCIPDEYWERLRPNGLAIWAEVAIYCLRRNLHDGLSMSVYQGAIDCGVFEGLKPNIEPLDLDPVWSYFLERILPFTEEQLLALANWCLLSFRTKEEKMKKQTLTTSFAPGDRVCHHYSTERVEAATVMEVLSSGKIKIAWDIDGSTACYQPYNLVNFGQPQTSIGSRENEQ